MNSRTLLVGIVVAGVPLATGDRLGMAQILAVAMIITAGALEGYLGPRIAARPRTAA